MPGTNPATKPTTNPSARTIAEWKFEPAAATTEQKAGHAAASVLSDAKDAGWGVAAEPLLAGPAVATFRARQKFSAADATGLTIVLEQKSSSPQHTLGRFRVWVTSNPNPDAAETLPAGDPGKILKKTSPDTNARIGRRRN